jgi:hypothetical protein
MRKIQYEKFKCAKSVCTRIKSNVPFENITTTRVRCNKLSRTIISKRLICIDSKSSIARVNVKCVCSITMIFKTIDNLRIF